VLEQAMPRVSDRKINPIPIFFHIPSFNPDYNAALTKEQGESTLTIG
jgi:hypothetical protein